MSTRHGRRSVLMSFEARATKMTPRHIARHVLTVLLIFYFLKEFDSNRVSCRFNTTAKRKLSAEADWKLRQDLLHYTDVYRIRSDNLSFRALAQEQKSN